MATIDNTIQDLGNGLGYIYQTKPDGTTIVSNIPNTTEGINTCKRYGLTDSPLASEIASHSEIILGGVAGQIDAITVNSVSLMSSAATGATVALVAIAAANNINAKTTVPNYRAKASGSTVVIFADEGRGSNPNGYAVTVTVSGGLTEDHSSMHGGQSATGIYDTAYGHRYFLNANYDSNFVAGAGSASQGVLGNSVEVTKYFVMRGNQGHFDISELTIDTYGNVSPTRTSNEMMFIVDTNGLAATDNLDSIDTEGFNSGDKIIIRAKNTSRVTTVRHLASGGNIVLSSGVNWSTAGYENALTLQYWNHSLGPRWYETSRAPSIAATVTALRNQSIPQPASGSDSIVLTAGGGTVNLVPGTDEEIQRVTGSPVLTSGWTIQGGGSPIDGDKFWIEYVATPTVGANTVTFFGQTLTTKQAQGTYPIWILARYIGSLSAWSVAILVDAASRDYEPDAGLPGTSGMVLASTTGGVRSWALNPPAASVTISKLADTDIRQSVQTLDLSFASGETGTFEFVWPFKCKVIAIRGEVGLLIEATDDGTIDFKNAALLSMGTLTFLAGSATGTNFSISPSANNSFAAGDTMTIAVAKTTAGGKARCDITIKRLD